MTIMADNDNNGINKPGISIVSKIFSPINAVKILQ